METLARTDASVRAIAPPIAQIETHCLRLPYRNPVQFQSVKQSAAEYILLVLRLEDGQEGIAEAVCRPEFSGEDARSQSYVIETFFKPVLVGSDPLAHAAILGRLDRFRGLAAAKALVDVALWDLKGKLLGQPVWRLLGGGPVRPVPLTWVVHGTERVAQCEEARRMAESRGYRGMKLKTWKRSEEDVSLVRDVREALGPDMTIYVDCNMTYSETEARTILARLGEHNIAFIEDPCRQPDMARQVDLARRLPVAILGDMTCETLDDAYRLIQARAVGGVSIKLRRTGLTQSLKIIALAEAAGIPAVIGTDSESRIGALVRAHLHVGTPALAAWPTETHFFDKLAEDVFAGEFRFDAGQIIPNDTPGFGAAIDRTKLQQHVI
jgi:L-Ala-D/L-Glu epimerase / N-acetyl-D-glutamate racemase